ncbi:MAG: tetratricopeptide repeat protein [Bacteroidales bacterium]|nr:tetratricopeptide repeat protein [Bacteroidales bacterium]
MKKVFLLLFSASLFCIGVHAQNDGKAQSLRNNITKNDAAIQDAKKNIKPDTWMDRGKLFYDAYGLNVHYLRMGMPVTEAKLFFQNPKEILTAQNQDGSVIETHVYSFLKLNFEKGVLKNWEEVQQVVPNALQESINAYRKAQSLDDKNKFTKKISDAMASINNDLEQKAFNEYSLQHFSDAYKSAQQKIELNESRGIVDTAYYYYAGYFAYAQSEIDNSMWNEAISGLDKAIQNGYVESDENVGLLYEMLYSACVHLSDTARGIRYVEAGLAQNPDNQRLIYTMINFYMQKGESEKALDFIAKAKTGGSENSTLLFAEGTLYDKMGLYDKAIESYDAAIAINPNDFSAYFNKGVVLYNSAVRLMEEADKAKVNAEFERLKNIADDGFFKVIAPMEAAHALNPKDSATLETLKSLYFRLRLKYPEMQAKYDDVVKLLENL